MQLYESWYSQALELDVANHELLGHGSGKLFQENADGTKNFDPDKVCLENWKIRPETDIISRS
jgi:dipeptidyl-peptidase III